MTRASPATPLSAFSAKVPVLGTESSTILMQLVAGDQSIEEVQNLVGCQPAVVAKLISLANSAWSNPVSAVTTIDVACARLGLDVVKTVSIALLVGKPFDVSLCPSFDRTWFWASSILTADIAATLAPNFDSDPESSRTAGLLHNIGLLWLADILPNETNEALAQRLSESDKSLDQALSERCGVGYRQAGGHLFKVWRLPNVLVAGIGVQPENATREEKSAHRVIEASRTLAASIYTGGEDTDIPAPEIPQSIVDAVVEQQLHRLPKTLELAKALPS